MNRLISLLLHAWSIITAKSSVASRFVSTVTLIRCNSQFRLSEILTLALLKDLKALRVKTSFSLALKIHLVQSRPYWVTFHEQDCLRIHHADAATATDTVVNSALAYCFMITFRTGTSSINIFLKLLLPVCLWDFLTVERKDNIVCCLRFILKLSRENISAAGQILTPSNDSPCTRADVPAKNSSCMADQKMYPNTW